MKIIKFLLILLTTMLVSFSSTYFFYTHYIILDIQVLDMKAKVGKVVGLDTNTSAVSFGIIQKGGSAKRPLILRNTNTKPVKVRITKTGTLAPWVYLSENNFVLKPNESKELTATAIPPLMATEGPYYGQFKFTFTRIL